MANRKNLVNLSDRTTDEQRKIAKIGGIKSGEARRNKKTMRETLEFILDSERLPTNCKQIKDITEDMLASGYAEDEINLKTILVFSILINAISGKSPKYTELILGIIGEAPNNKIEVAGAEALPPVTFINRFVGREEFEDIKKTNSTVVCLPDNGRD